MEEDTAVSVLPSLPVFGSGALSADDCLNGPDCPRRRYREDDWVAVFGVRDVHLY